MLGIFSTHAALTESGLGFGSGPAYEFTGTFNESVAEFGHLVMAESYNMNAYAAEADEIIAEAVMAGEDYRVDVLIENVFQDMVKRARELWERLKKWVKGLIAKLEAFILQITGQTNKWASKMESRIKAASPTDFKYDFHKWDIGNLDKLCDKSVGDVRKKNKLIKSGSPFGGSYTIEQMLDTMKDGVKRATELQMSRSQSASFESNAKEYDSQTFKENAKKGMLEAYATYFGVSGFNGNGEKELLSKIDKMVSGGEKLTQTVDSGTADRMLEYVKNCKDRLTKTKEMYKDLKSELDKESEKLTEIQTLINEVKGHEVTGMSAEQEKDDSASKEDKDSLKNFKSMFTNQINTVSSICASEKKFVGDLGNLATRSARTCANEYMAALTAYCNASEKQNKKKK